MRGGYRRLKAVREAGSLVQAGGLDKFSLQSGLKYINGGRLGDGFLASAFLGNSVQSVGDTIAALAQGALI